ncbi:zinc metalloproteinase nas-15-like [Antedon mediterranea]|uniref:zinc metalloproteinase nas-15-like n=1 Tax=Antedon mediterranea TaxID=105859 RepID=UPI003AF49E51
MARSVDLIQVKIVQSQRLETTYYISQRCSPGKCYPEMSINSYAKSQIQKAIDRYSSKTCIKWVARTSENNYVNIVKKNGCYSHVGIQGGVQELSLASGCYVKVGIIMHEMMHAIGFYHEQSRTDRDSYVSIQWQNIQDGELTRPTAIKSRATTNSDTGPTDRPDLQASLNINFMYNTSLSNDYKKSNDDYLTFVQVSVSKICVICMASKEHNFKSYPSSEIDDLGVSYDYHSIMHYDAYTFSKNGYATIIPKESGVTIGNRADFSSKDIEKINKYYKCAPSDNRLGYESHRLAVCFLSEPRAGLNVWRPRTTGWPKNNHKLAVFHYTFRIV